MSKICVTILGIIILTLPAFCQEPDTLSAPAQTVVPDSATLQRAREGFVPLWDTAGDERARDTLAFTARAPRVQADSLTVVEPDFSHSPSQAVMYALVLPGMGQAYNKKYYKIPIVWAALGVAGYAINYNTKAYLQASQDYALSPDDTNERYLRFWRRNLEISYIGLLVVYALQVVDSYVDAQLYSWDVNPNLSLKVSPSMQPLMDPASLTGQAYGLTCSINLKRRK
jgi:hypothetical protein